MRPCALDLFLALFDRDEMASAVGSFVREALGAAGGSIAATASSAPAAPLPLPFLPGQAQDQLGGAHPASPASLRRDAAYGVAGVCSFKLYKYVDFPQLFLRQLVPLLGTPVECSMERAVASRNKEAVDSIVLQGRCRSFLYQ